MSLILQKIYDSIGISFNIKEEPIMDISSIVQGNEIVSEDAETMSTYSQQQQQINAMYKGQSNDRYVVFLTSKGASTNQKGYMRLNGQYGYVYGNAETKTLAHEIGHGVFRLEHPWSKYKTTKNSSNLLLDYKAQGRELSHLDWQQINDPAFKLYAFQSQSSGQYSVAEHFSLTYDLLLYYGVDKTTANKIAYYASVYSDHPNAGIIALNTVQAPFFGENPLNMFMDTKKYTASHNRTKNSQSTEYIDKEGGVVIHGMLAWWEGDYEEKDINIIKLYLACDKHYPTILDEVFDINIEDAKKIIINKINQDNKLYLPPIDPLLATINSMPWKDILASISLCNECKNRLQVFTSQTNRNKNNATANDRSLKEEQLEVVELDGSHHKVQGAEYILLKHASSGKGFDNLTEEEMAKIGLALHTIQDCQVHQGGRWDDSIKKRVKALKMVIKEGHPIGDCLLNTNSISAEQQTKEFIGIIKNYKK